MSLDYIGYFDTLKHFGLSYGDKKNFHIIVTDEQIQSYITNNNFIDVSDGIHLNNSSEHHAQRIASLIDLIKKGKKLNSVIVYANDQYTEYEIEDGYHRLRAYQFLKYSFPCKIFYLG